jgi:hypothetical protein
MVRTGLKEGRPDRFGRSSLLAYIVGLVEQLDWAAGHDRGDSVLIDQLRMTIPAQQDAEIVEPGHDTLKFHSVHEEDREGNFVLSDVIEKGVLKVLRAIARHGSCLASPPPPVLAVGQPT